MQQRRLRLGDVLDDYCPRERRVTNHAVVAIVGDEVRQTRCTTCDAEHDYRHAKVPAPRKAKAPGAPGADAPGGRPVLAVHRTEAPSEPDEATSASVESTLEMPPSADSTVGAPDLEPPVAHHAASGSSVSQLSQVDQAPAQEHDRTQGDARDDDGPVHRPLIRATFPRPEGHVPTRREPEFTIRQPAGPRRGHGHHGYGGQSSGGGRAFGGDAGWGRGGHRGGGQHAGGQRQGGGFGRGPRQGGGPGRKSGR